MSPLRDQKENFSGTNSSPVKEKRSSFKADDDYLAKRVADLEERLAIQFRLEGSVQILKEENERLTKMLIDKTADSMLATRGSYSGLSKISLLTGGSESKSTEGGNKNEVELLKHEINMLTKSLETKNEEIKLLRSEVLALINKHFFQ